MQNIFNISKSSYGVDETCLLASKSIEDQWECMFAPYSYKYISTPLLVINSQYDSWQLQNILQVPYPCYHNVSTCNSTEWDLIDNYHENYFGNITTILQENCWIDSCFLHGQILEKYYNQPKVDNVTMNDIISSFVLIENNTHISPLIDQHTCLP